MDSIMSIETPEEYNIRIKELFKGLVSEGMYDAWADTFEVESADDKRVIITYHGAEDIKEFKKECRSTLVFCVYSVFGAGKKIKIIKETEYAEISPKPKKTDRTDAEPKTKKTVYSDISPKTKKNIQAFKFFVIGMIFVCMATAVIVVMCNYIGNRSFRETFYNVSSIKVDSNIRIVQLSDLHGSSYGKDNKNLLERVKALEPDIIICTGDMVDSLVDDTDHALLLAQGLSEIAPSYYVYGNNEVEDIYDVPLNEKALDEKFGFDKDTRDETALLSIEDSFEQQLEAVGIKVLKNEKDTIKVKTMTVDVYGVLTSNPSSFWSYSGNAFSDYIYEDTNNIKITAVHEPFVFEEFTPETWGDLMLCGHTHGGVMRIPVLGPLFTHEGGLFPERKGGFVYGRYDAAGSPLIVSSGLENSSILRINNQPELVVIDINKF